MRQTRFISAPRRPEALAQRLRLARRGSCSRPRVPSDRTFTHRFDCRAFRRSQLIHEFSHQRSGPWWKSGSRTQQVPTPRPFPDSGDSLSVPPGTFLFQQAASRSDGSRFLSSLERRKPGAARSMHRDIASQISVEAHQRGAPSFSYSRTPVVEKASWEGS